MTPKQLRINGLSFHQMCMLNTCRMKKSKLPLSSLQCWQFANAAKQQKPIEWHKDKEETTIECIRGSSITTSNFQKNQMKTQIMMRKQLISRLYQMLAWQNQMRYYSYLDADYDYLSVSIVNVWCAHWNDYGRLLLHETFVLNFEWCFSRATPSPFISACFSYVALWLHVCLYLFDFIRIFHADCMMHTVQLQ